jgi:hypothetical protein
MFNQPYNVSSTIIHASGFNKGFNTVSLRWKTFRASGTSTKKITSLISFTSSATWHPPPDHIALITEGAESYPTFTVKD